MGSARANGGLSFENEVIDRNGWGKTNGKLVFFGRGVQKQYYEHRHDLKGLKLCNKPSLTKHDAVTDDGEYIEIKKTHYSDFMYGVLYGEPFGAIKDGGKVYFKNFNTNNFNKWNMITEEMFDLAQTDPYWTNIMDQVEKNLVSIYTIDGIIKAEHLEAFLDISGKKHKRIGVYVKIKSKHKGLYK